MRNRMLIGAGIAAFIVLTAVVVRVGVGTVIAHNSGAAADYAIDRSNLSSTIMAFQSRC